MSVNAFRVLVLGADGRMGKAVAMVAAASADVTLSGAERGQAIDHLIADCDVVLDFSHADATERNCSACLANQKPLVIGTTGQSHEQVALIRRTSDAVPILVAANFSVGVNTLFWLTRKAAEMLGDGFDLEVVETHHRLKKDAPSGTAKQLAQILCEARDLDVDKNIAHGRQGLVGEKPSAEIGMHSVRSGDVVGDHTVIFASSGERLELTHKASSRETFATGALRAARWIIGKPPALYSMQDVLGL